MSTFYITTPIYYVNDLPHIGHIYTSIVADTLCRYRRMAGDQTYLLTGTDEHGQKIERAAAEQGVKPIELADRVVSRYRELLPELGVANDDFVRTTQERHRLGVEEIVRRMKESGDLYRSEYEGWYCASEEAFIPDSQVEDGIDTESGKPVERVAEPSWFFRLSAYEDRLLEWYRSSPESVRPKTRYNEVVSFVEGGLKDMSVSRASVKWGIPLPLEPEHTVYVWLDALTNYVSALGLGSEDTALYDRFWAGDGTRIHLVGKDILRFHAVYWPAFLMSAGLPLPTTVWAHGWWLRDNKKISKSEGAIVRPDDLIERFGADSLRYFLLREMAFGQDATFSDEAFIDRYNSDLANDLGNTVSRIVTLARRAFDGKTPHGANADGPLVAAAAEAVEKYREAMADFVLQRGLESLWRLLAEVNQYIVANEPWKMIKDETARPELARVLWSALEAVRIVTTGLLPFMPKVAEQVLEDLGCSETDRSLAGLEWGATPAGAELPKSAPRFPRIDKKAYLGEAEEKAAPEKAEAAPVKAEEGAAQISIDQFMDVELRVGTVVDAEALPKSKKLLKLTVDLGEAAPRTVVAGIALEYAPDDVKGKQVVVVANLKPAKLMGVQSQGMVLAASEDGKPGLLHPPQPVANGTRVR